VKEIAPGVHQIADKNVNTFAIVADDGIVLIDAGNPRRAETILAALAKLGAGKKRPVTDVLITHYHADHVGGLADLVATTGAKVWAPQGDVHIIKGGGRPPDMEYRGVLGFVVSRMLHMGEQAGSPVDHEVIGGQTVPVAGGIQAIDSPGHTGGHIVYLWQEFGGVLFAGDAAANLIGVDAMPVNENNRRAEQSFVDLAGRSFEVAGFGHGRPLFSGASDRFRRRAQRLRARPS
jgi:glyoxylase-like metal-dependent hydrolase (beta-lactamase superfamily II)